MWGPPSNPASMPLVTKPKGSARSSPVCGNSSLNQGLAAPEILGEDRHGPLAHRNSYLVSEVLGEESAQLCRPLSSQQATELALNQE